MDQLNDIVKNSNKFELDSVGSKIVGCTIAAEGIEDVYSEYPLLEEIAELGSSLEAEKDLKQQQAYFKLIKDKLDQLNDLSQV